MVRFISALSMTPSKNSGTTVSMSPSTGTIFLVTVPGNLSEKLQILSSAAKKGNQGQIFTSNDLQVITRIKNTGKYSCCSIWQNTTTALG